MRIRKSLVALAASVALVGTMAACTSSRNDNTGATADSTAAATGGSGAAAGDAMIGIAMPTKSLERWNNDGAHLEKVLKDMGYRTSLQYADNKVDQQITQLQNMINEGAKVLVIASIDGTALGPVLDQAKAAGIKVLAYDRLINGSANVDYYATFDNEKVGTLQGNYIVDTLGLAEGKGPFNFEPFAGSPDDNNAKFFFKGAWDVVSKYVEDGKLVVQSGKAPKTLDQWTSIGIQGWETTKAQAEMDNRLNSFYTGDKKVQVVLSPNDSLALGIEQSLETAGYKVGSDWPLVTGQDADLANVKNLMAGKQSMTVFKNTTELGDQVAKMVDAMVKGTDVPVNNTDSYNNGVKNVPSYLLDPVVVTKDNAEKILVTDTGYYTKADLGLS